MGRFALVVALLYLAACESVDEYREFEINDSYFDCQGSEMLDKYLEPECPIDECPECGATMTTRGDKYEGTADCTECGYGEEWSFLGDGDDE